MIIEAHRVTTEEAWMMSELGTGLSLEPWGQDTREYKGHSEPIQVEVPNDTRVLENANCVLMLYRGTDLRAGYTLQDAIALG